MARSKCPNCGATVDLAKVEEGGKTYTVALDLAVEPGPTEADLYQIVGHNPLRAVRSIRGGQPEHGHDCPASNAGR